MKQILTILLLVLFTYSFSGIVIVTNINNSGAGSLRDATTIALSGDTINFDPLLISSGNATIVLTSNIFINKPLTINGLYNSTDSLFITDNLSISGSNQAFFINVLSAGNVVLNNLFFDSFGNSFSQKDEGGAIKVNNLDSLIINNSSFTRCRARNEGGAIYSKDPLKLKNCTFKNNTSGDGGAVYSISIVQSDSCSFFNNTASSYGGAIKCDSLIMKGSVLSNNTSRSTLDSKYYCRILDSKINNNQGNLECLGTLILNSCVIENNFHTTSYSSSGVRAPILSIDSSSIINNTSINLAIVLAEPTYLVTNTSISITNTSIKNNAGQQCEMIRSRGTILIKNSFIDSNTITGSGSNRSIIRSDELLRIENTSVNFNYSDGSSVIIAEDDAEIFDSRFNNNKSDTLVNLLFAIRVDDSLVIKRSEVNNNITGGINAYSYSDLDSINVIGNKYWGIYSNQAVLKNSNIAKSEVGVVVSYLTLINSEVFSNKSFGTWGSFIFTESSSIYNNGSWGIQLTNARSFNPTLNGSILKTTIYGNIGGIHSTSCDTVKITNSTIYNNIHSVSGAAAVSVCKLICESSIITCNLPINFQVVPWSSSVNEGFTSLGHNIFGDIPILRPSVIFIHPTDSTNATCNEVNLDTLDYYGGITKTAVPLSGSIAINSGNPNDLSNAQNGILIGRRDIGASEKNGLTSDLNENNLNKINIYPNPTNGTFTLDLGEQINLNRIFITDINGRFIKEITPQNVTQYEVNFEGTPGIYLLNVVGENERTTLKIIKE